ncbi:sensor histidine kinase [Geomonas azotofigens]|uniref:sensor histidine kinase n=1 Tax=Geomonas azotofigens TaxID=2843196 RepID=UPI001C11C378|nr:ATP-binding protein [Geomonas azotofigens]MBU5614968.1 PAS domain-containing protein [Geomonas azotofigens]
MEQHLFELLCITAAVASFFVVIPTNYLQHLPAYINVCVAVFGVLVLLLLVEARRGRYHTTALFFMFLVLLNLIWFPNGASDGSLPLYYFCLLMYLPIFFRRRARWLPLVLTLLDAIALMALEFQFPEWVTPFRSEQDRLADNMVGFAVTTVCCAVMMWSLLRSYEREQGRLVAMNEELQQMIVERAAVEGALVENRELLNSVIDGTTDAVFVKDVSGRYLLFNQAACHMAGKSMEQVLGRDDREVFSAGVAQAFMLTDQEVLRDNLAQTLEQELEGGDGERITLEVIKGPLHNKQGDVVGLFSIARDVTHSRRMAEELRLLNEELERRVAERTARLEAAMREQEAFSYSVSHDLRGPLRHINSYGSILIEEYGPTLEPEARGYLERIRTSSKRMGDLIDDLLELSRIGRLELRRATVSLSELAFGIGCKLQDAEPARRVDLLIEPGLQVQGDRLLLELMLENLVGNAWKYSSGRERARIELGACTHEGEETFFIRDNGVGFDMAYQDKLFGAFQRLHGSEFEGTGIGLATVKRIVERHGGTVWAKGVVDEGATVYFTLPGA